MSTELIAVLRLAVPRMATVASIWGCPEDTKDFLAMNRLLEKLLEEKSKKAGK